VEGYTGRTFDLVTGDVAVMDPHPHRRAMLPCYPVTAATAVQGYLPGPDGLTWTTLTNYAFVAETGLIYDTTGLPGVLSTSCSSWPWLPGSLEVTYDHGYAVVPQGLVDVACRLAQQYLENPALQMQRRVGEQEGRFAGSAGVVITELDARILDRYTDVSVA
jgi:hypothetical protein